MHAASRLLRRRFPIKPGMTFQRTARLRSPNSQSIKESDVKTNQFSSQVVSKNFWTPSGNQGYCISGQDTFHNPELHNNCAKRYFSETHLNWSCRVHIICKHRQIDQHTYFQFCICRGNRNPDRSQNAEIPGTPLHMHHALPPKNL